MTKSGAANRSNRWTEDGAKSPHCSDPTDAGREFVGWMKRCEITTGALFLPKAGSRPTQSNWGRALRRASRMAEWQPSLTPYGLRRTNASPPRSSDSHCRSGSEAWSFKLTSSRSTMSNGLPAKNHFRTRYSISSTTVTVETRSNSPAIRLGRSAEFVAAHLEVS